MIPGRVVEIQPHDSSGDSVYCSDPLPATPAVVPELVPTIEPDRPGPTEPRSPSHIERSPLSAPSRCRAG